jgi:HD-like signal output (HDOD) protein
MVTVVSGNDARAKALRALGKLPPFSPVLNRLMATLADEDVSFGEVSDLIEKDTVMAGNVLRMVNSALYAWRGTINSVRHAVSLMGLAKLRNTVMTLSVARMLNHRELPAGWSPAQFNLHAAASAILADLLAAELDVEYPEGAFAAGLLQNVGMLLMAIGLPREHERVRDLCERGGQELIEAERFVLGLDHADLSREVLAQWNLPEPIRVAVANHHGPHEEDGHFPLSRVVEMADRIANLRGIPVQAWMRPVEGNLLDGLDEVGLTDRAERIVEAFENEYEVTRSFFR